MQFTMYSRFIPTLAKLGAAATADYAANLGFSSVEVLETTSPGHPSVIPDRETAENIRKIFAERGLTVACYSVGTCLYRSPEAEESLKYQAEIAAALGCPFLHHTLLPWLKRTGDLPSFDEALEITADAAARVAKYAEPLGVTCLYEDQGLYANGVTGFGAFYREIKNRTANVGVCGDVGNVLFVDESPVPFFREFIGEIRHVHIKDYLYKTKTPVSPGMYWLETGGGNWVRDTMIGHGDLDIAGCMEILKNAGYTGALAFENEHPEPYEAGVKQGMDCLKRFL